MSGRCIAYLTTVALIARKNKIEKKAPINLSNKKALFTSDCDIPGNIGIAGGSTKNFVPERKTVALKLIASLMLRGQLPTKSYSSIAVFDFFKPTAFQMTKMSGIRNNEKTLRGQLLTKLYLLIASFGCGKLIVVQKTPKSPIKKIDHSNGYNGFLPYP